MFSGLLSLKCSFFGTCLQQSDLNLLEIENICLVLVEGGGGALYVGHHGVPAKKMLGFRWSKKTEVT